MAWAQNAKFWPAFKAAGYLVEASAVAPGGTEPTTFDVELLAPEEHPLTGVRSVEWTMEYQTHDAPWLREGAEVVVDGVLYRMRANPQPSDTDPDGYFQIAILTRVGTVCAP
jgi:hypothetical protein